MQKVLLIDSDIALSQSICNYLVNNSFWVESVNSGRQAIEKLNHANYDTILLDTLLPDIEGHELLKNIVKHCNTPILIHSTKHESVEVILSLELGADHYLPKPSPMQEIVAHLRALLRRSYKVKTEHPSGPEKLELIFKNLVLDASQYICKWNNRILLLTYTEFNFLKLFIMNQGNILKREYLSEQVLGKPLLAYDRSLDAHICNIRQKLKTLSGDHITIETIRRIGYRIK